ncbi:MAG: GNAT family N-acetyltransferase [Thermomicrobiales bacterium]|nr:GNAT family N-acetyltransferase [Thermomicrobiales bacterium]
MGIAAPVPLREDHDCTSFHSGEDSLDHWLQQRAREGQSRGAARTFVSTNDDREVIGYYALSAGAVMRESAPGNLRRNMPDPIPVIVLGRLAVDLRYQGSGLGSALLKDAMLRALNASREIGAAALVVHALTDDLRDYYARFGFVEYPEGARTLYLPMKTIAAALV